MFLLYFLHNIFPGNQEKIPQNQNFQKIFLFCVRNIILSKCTKFEVPTTHSLREKKYTLGSHFFWNFPNELNGMNLFWWILLILGSNLLWNSKIRCTSRRCNFLQSSHSSMMLYIFEKYSSRSLDSRCLFDEMENLTPPKIELKFIEFWKNPECRFAQLHLIRS